jgi:hypothetical protein
MTKRLRRRPLVIGATLLVVALVLYVAMQRAVAAEISRCACPGEENLGVPFTELIWGAPMVLAGLVGVVSLLVSLSPKRHR